MSWLDKLKNGMRKTADCFSFSMQQKLDLEEWEDALLMSDAGVQTTNQLLEVLKSKKLQDMAQARVVLKEEIISRLETVAQPLHIQKDKTPFVVLFLGVNGAGKTTTIGKLGAYYRSQGYQVSFVAADTFRAGAVEQLQLWGQRAQCPVYTGQKDAGALVYDALQQSKQKGDDILFVDTAGRLQNRVDLMDEMKKIIRVLQKIDPTAPHATLLVLDATLGQNALAQVEGFSKVAPVSGLIMTKLDGTAKGGILLALAQRFHLPIHAIGVGEKIDDLQPFTAQEYVNSLLGES